MRVVTNRWVNLLAYILGYSFRVCLWWQHMHSTISRSLSQILNLLPLVFLNRLLHVVYDAQFSKPYSLSYHLLNYKIVLCNQLPHFGYWSCATLWTSLFPVQVVAITVFFLLSVAFYAFFAPFLGKDIYEYLATGIYSFLVSPIGTRFFFLLLFSESHKVFCSYHVNY